MCKRGRRLPSTNIRNSSMKLGVRLVATPGAGRPSCSRCWTRRAGVLGGVSVGMSLMRGFGLQGATMRAGSFDFMSVAFLCGFSR